MKTVVSISMGAPEQDYEFTASFLGTRFKIKRIGVNKDPHKAEELIRHWQDQADAIALEGLRNHHRVGTYELQQEMITRLEGISDKVTSGSRLREILQEWSIRQTQDTLPGLFNNAHVLIFSGMNHYRSASILSEYTANMRFADPVLQLGLPKFLTSFRNLELFARGSHQILRWTPPETLSPSVAPMKEWNHYILRKAMHKAHVVVAMYEELEKFGLQELAGKIVITSSVSEQRLAALGERGVDMVLDYAPQPFKQTISNVVLEAMILASRERDRDSITDDDFLEILSDLDLKPRILYPNGFKRRSRFAFVIHPLSQRYLAMAKPLEVISKYSPKAVMNAAERIIAYSPPFIYSTVTGIKSPTGAEAEGWLISVGGTPKQIMAHSPEFTYRRLLAAADIAKKLGAQIMGLGAFTKVVGDAGVTVAKRAPLPITTGNSYSASGALWAASYALKKIGLVKVGPRGKMKAKAMFV